jgi:hypothetical protein
MDQAFGKCADGDHDARPHDDEATTITEIGRAMCGALDNGDAVVCIASDAHRRSLERHVIDCGIDIIAARASNQIVCLDAAGTLTEISNSGAIDVVKFAEVVGAVIDQASCKYSRVWIFGELAALMSANGHHAGAIELERLWSSFIASRPAVFLHLRAIH